MLDSKETITKDCDLAWYFDQIIDEVKKLKEKRFTGKFCFEFNYYSGGITNINIISNRSLKK